MEPVEHATLLLSMRQTAKTLNVSERTIFSMVQRGELPFVRIGRRVLFSRSALVAWIAEQGSKGGANHA